MINNINEIERLKKEVWHLQMVVLPNLNNKIDTLSGGNGSKFDAITKELASISSQLQSISKEVNANSTYIDSLTTSVEHLESNVSTIQWQLESINARLDEINVANEGIIDSFIDINSNINFHTSELFNHKTRLENLEKSDATQTEDISTIQSKLNSIDTRLDEINEANEEIVDSFIDINGNINFHTSELFNHKTRIENLETANTANTNNISNLQTDLDSVNNLLDEINTLTEGITDSFIGINENINFHTSELYNHKTRIEKLEASDKTQTTNISTLQSELATTKTNLSDVSTKATNNASSISSLNTTVNSHATSISSHNTRIGKLESSNTTNTNNITSMQKSLTSINSRLDEINKANEAITDSYVTLISDSNFHTSELGAHNTRITKLETANTTNTNNITSTQNSIKSLTTKIDDLTKEITALKSSGGGETIEVIYDMRSTDANINRGFTTGLIGNKYFSIDLTPYKYLRIYANLANFECQTVLNLAERYKLEFTLCAISNTYLAIHFMKGQITEKLDRFAALGYSIFTCTKSTGSWTVENGSNKANMIIYRVEGIK